MPRVPYDGVPDVAASDRGLPSISISTPAGAFGGESAEAMQGLGRVVEASADKIFQRAIALQDLANQTEADEADTQYMIQAGKLHADYNSLQGKDAVAAFPKYSQDLQALRDQIAGSLSNPMSRKRFDQASRSTMGRTIFNGANHAASENRQWAIGTAKAQIDLDAKTVEDDPRDDINFQNKLSRIKESTAALAGLDGYEAGSPQERRLQQAAVSKAWTSRIIGLARIAPFEAAQMLDKNRKNLTEQDYLRVDGTVRTQSRAVGSANIANDVYTAGVGTEEKPGQTLAQMEEAARAKAKAMSPDDPILAQNAVTTLQGLWNQKKQAQAQEKYENLETINSAIQKGVKNEQELLANPRTAAAFEALPKSEQIAIPAKINRYNAARDKQTNEETFIRLKGMANNDLEAFLNTDVTKEALSKSDMDRLMTLQKKIKEQPFQDPRVSRAIGQIRGARAAELETLGIFRRTDSNKEEYDQYTGAVQQALDVWQETHGKPPTYKDITETIAPDVLRQRAVPGAIFGNFWPGKKSFFQQELPEDWKTDMSNKVIAAGGMPPTEAQLQRAYMREQFQKLYGAKAKATETPSVPVSK